MFWPHVKEVLLFSKIQKAFLCFFMMAQRVKRLPAMWETRVWSLGQEDPLEKEMATHFSILAWEILGTEEPEGLQFMELQKSWTQLSNHTTTVHQLKLSYIR